MPESTPNLSFYVDVLQTLEQFDIPYVIIGGFAATIYGSNRVTADIDMVVVMDESHIQALASAYPLPRYYADPNQMRNAFEIRSTFNIIDSETADRVDLFPLSTDVRYTPAFKNRTRKVIEVVQGQPIAVWVALPEDVILGKLMAWDEGKSSRHTNDIYEMMLFYYLGGEPEQTFDAHRVAAASLKISNEAADMWNLLNSAAKEAAQTE